MPVALTSNDRFAGWFRGQLWFGIVLILLGMARGQAQVSETVLHNFSSGGKSGENPQSPLFRDAAGNLYGTANGGAFSEGVVYKVDTMGHESVLHNFTGGPDGGNEFGDAGVVGDSAGNLYGTTPAGGGAGYGVVFKIDAAGTYTVLHTFSNGEDGGSPVSEVLDPAGNLYGTASSGGTGNYGVVFKVDAAGHFTVLHHFTGGNALSVPLSLSLDTAGNLYGTTDGEPSNGTCSASDECRGIYKLDPTGSYKVLYRFTNPNFVYSGVAPDADGNLYGTQGGGTSVGCDRNEPDGCGLIYKLDTAGHTTVLHTFTRSEGDLTNGVIRDPAGNLYGSAREGGDGTCDDGCGTVFKLDTAANFTVLHKFTGHDGNGPRAGVIRDAAGNLYGTTFWGGPSGIKGGGVVYKVDTTGQESVLFAFRMAPLRGADPPGISGDPAGNLYGTTYIGGVGPCTQDFGCGVAYKMDSNAQYTVLHYFTGGADGGVPNGVIRDSAGNLYGTTQLGGIVSPGVPGFGVVYKLDAAGSLVVLHTFVGGTEGGSPLTGVVRDPAGNLYGTTPGLIYKLDPAGNYTVLHAFGSIGQSFDASGVVLDAAGNLYGTVDVGQGVIYELDTSGNYSVLYSFSGLSDGSGPNDLIIDSAGNLYGTTAQGGANNDGVVFELDRGGNYSVLYTFTNGDDGSEPTGVILDPSGNLYGTTFSLHNFAYGLVFKLDTTGKFTALYGFSGGADGGQPNALVYGPGGNLVGTAFLGGKGGGGVVFALTKLP